MKKIVKIKAIHELTHDVLQIRTEKPDSLHFHPGQAADISIHKSGWEDELRAFTFTALPDDDFLEFTIKTYPEHAGVTAELRTLVPGDELIIHEVFGSIAYQGEGLFIAGGAGITPFIAILRDLEKKDLLGNNALLFANKNHEDIIQKDYFERILGARFINVLSQEAYEGCEQGYVTAELIRKYRPENTPYYYLCGPDPMMDAVQQSLKTLGVDENYIVREKF